jgi:hypothetical protein
MERKMKKMNSKVLMAICALAVSQIMCIYINAVVTVRVYEDLNSNSQKDDNESWMEGIGIEEFTNKTDTSGTAILEYQVKTHKDCIFADGPRLVVPAGYVITESHTTGWNGWDCDRIYLDTIFQDSDQSAEFVFGLGPAPVEQPAAVPTATSTPEIPANASISLSKSAEPGIYSKAGQTIQYTYIFTNTGDVPLTGPFTLHDDKLDSFECNEDLTALVLQPGDSATCFAGYITGNETDTIRNIARISGFYLEQIIESDIASAEVFYFEAEKPNEEPQPDPCAVVPAPEGCSVP